MKFDVFIYKELNPLVPSISQAKKIVLPGYEAPKKVIINYTVIARDCNSPLL